MRRKADRDRTITSLVAWSQAAQKTPPLSLAMISDFLQMVANAEGEAVTIVMPGNWRITREPKT
jgi:hypothetical protein